MFERSYPLVGFQPIAAMHRLLARLRDLDSRQEVTLANPPFERDDLNRIVAVRLRFRPRGPG